MIGMQYFVTQWQKQAIRPYFLFLYYQEDKEREVCRFLHAKRQKNLLIYIQAFVLEGKFQPSLCPTL